jgi:hypothetical protein
MILKSTLNTIIICKVWLQRGLKAPEKRGGVMIGLSAIARGASLTEMPSVNFHFGVMALAIFVLLQTAMAQYPQPNDPPTSTEAPTGLVSPQQLDDLVAPIALYPDPLLGEVLAAATYPVEIAEAEQWVRDHAHWNPSKLMNEAKKQNWDPSVQGLAAFPDVLARMTQDISWTTQLGNAFLAQQADVMSAVQRMRAEALAKGTLQSTPQDTVVTQNQGGQTAISIEPANPDVWYVPNYNPAYVWDHRLGDITRHFIILALIWVSGGIPASTSISVSAVGVDGDGAAGVGRPIGTAGMYSSTIPSFIVTVSAISTENLWATQCGPTTRITGLACPTAIGSWPVDLHPMASSPAVVSGDSLGRDRREGSAPCGSRISEILDSNSAAGRAITVFSVGITTAG